MLRFENFGEGASFLAHYGLHITQDYQFLYRDSFIEPESPMAVNRSPLLVERKLTTSVGEAVHGQPLPPNVVPQPSSSFDERGYFIGIIKPPDLGVADFENQAAGNAYFTHVLY